VTYDLGALRAFCSFSLGCLLYRYREFLLQKLSFIQPLLLQWLVLTSVVTLFITNATPLFYIPLWILLIASFTYEHTTLARALSWGPLVRLGEMSYSLYMVHALVLWPLIASRTLAPNLLNRFISWPPLLILLTLLGATCLISVFTYRYIENPGRSYIRKRFERKSRPTTAVANACTQ
jgi:peptidoglycan/LPS O-acetylase OafA/YrhL